MVNGEKVTKNVVTINVRDNISDIDQVAYRTESLKIGEKNNHGTPAVGSIYQEDNITTGTSAVVSRQTRGEGKPAKYESNKMQSTDEGIIVKTEKHQPPDGKDEFTEKLITNSEVMKDYGKQVVQTKTTTPAAPARAGGLIEGATITTAPGATMSSPDGKDTVKAMGTAEFTIMKSQEGKMVAVSSQDSRQLLVSAKGTATQEITATLKVDGQPPKQIKLDVAKDGALTEMAPPSTTPKGQAKSAEPMR